MHMCCANFAYSSERNKLNEKDRKYFLEHNPAYPPANKECNDPKYMAADIIACENAKHPVKDSEDMDLYSTKHIHRRRRVTAHWLAWPKHMTSPFLQAIQAFNQQTCIKLIPRTGQRDYIALFSGEGCYTFLGRNGGRQPLSLQAYSGCAQKGVAIHEIMHVLGFYHEMARRDRDEHIRIHFDNIYTGWWRQFRMHEYSNGSVWGEDYDPQSVMHYGNYAAAINSNRMTLTSVRNPREILGQRNGMSRKDAIQINRMYECANFVNRV
ncbi:hatching enzyme 1.2-like [Hydractinia symbiolongicarpus]|uniref:hatching enzyme 1.2-like n=1 Tax=Hydractinia symbiolongicarpus TaxID=13093 RepID=UPI00254AFD3A|nr:hatching enzyme 1.2-like [Hydractinia symbiolongicarpus]